MANLQVNYDQKTGRAVIEGNIDDKAELKKLFGPIPEDKRVKISCGGIQRFNSIGIKNWIAYFEDLVRQSVELEFWECSPAVVEQCNLIRNFLANGKVMSIQIPFRCDSCKTYFVSSRTAGELKTANYVVADHACPKCGKPASFDDLPEAYFAFFKLTS